MIHTNKLTLQGKQERNQKSALAAQTKHTIWRTKCLVHKRTERKGSKGPKKKNTAKQPKLQIGR